MLESPYHAYSQVKIYNRPARNNLILMAEIPIVQLLHSHGLYHNNYPVTLFFLTMLMSVNPFAIEIRRL